MPDSSAHVLRREQRLEAPPEAVFPFFADARNLEAITPPLLRFRLLTPEPISMGPGTFLQYALQIHRMPVRWDTLIQEWDPPHQGGGPAVAVRRRAGPRAVPALAPHARAGGRGRWRGNADARHRPL